MPNYTTYPVYYKDKDGKEHQLNAQTLTSDDLPDTYLLAYNSNASVPPISLMSYDDLDSRYNQIPLAPYVSDIGNKSGLGDYFKAGLDIADIGGLAKISDIALAGTRPVRTNTLRITLPFTDFESDGHVIFSTVLLRIYVSRDKTTNVPFLYVQKEYYHAWDGTAAPAKTEILSQKRIPDVPYFVFNLGAVAPGAPGVRGVDSAGSPVARSFTVDGENRHMYIHPGGGSGAGGLFTAVLSTNTVQLAKPSGFTGSPEHTDQIIIFYFLANPSSSTSSSSLVGFWPYGYMSPGIDFIQVHAELHYKSLTDKKLYRYSVNYTYPGGRLSPAANSLSWNFVYSSFANTLLDNAENKTNYSYSYDNGEDDYDTSLFRTFLYLHQQDFAYPAVTLYGSSHSVSIEIDLSSFNPECMAPLPYRTMYLDVSLFASSVSPYCTEICGRPSILASGPGLFREQTTNSRFLGYGGLDGDNGAGGSGSLSVNSSNPTLGNGGPAAVILSW